MDTTGSNDVSGEAWASRVRGLSATERAARLDAVNTLLGQSDDISDSLESELYILRDQLTAR